MALDLFALDFVKKTRSMSSAHYENILIMSQMNPAKSPKLKIKAAITGQFRFLIQTAPSGRAGIPWHGSG